MPNTARCMAPICPLLVLKRTTPWVPGINRMYHTLVVRRSVTTTKCQPDEHIRPPLKLHNSRSSVELGVFVAGLKVRDEYADVDLKLIT